MQPLNWGRIPYGDTFISVDVPFEVEMDNAVVIMTGYEPASYIIPYFPRSTKFVRIESNLAAPGVNKSVDARITNILDKSQQATKFVILPVTDPFERVNKIVGFYKFSIDQESCQVIKTNLGNENKICRLI